MSGVSNNTPAVPKNIRKRIKARVDRLDKLEKYVLYGSIIFPVAVLLFDYIYNKSKFGDFQWYGDVSNWTQAFISVWTLLAVMYTARKTSFIANNSNRIAQNSARIMERDTTADLLIHICQKLNENYIKQEVYVTALRDIRKLERSENPADKISAQFAEHSLIERYTPELFMAYKINMAQAMKIIENNIYNNDKSYKILLITYLSSEVVFDLYTFRSLNLNSKMIEATGDKYGYLLESKQKFNESFKKFSKFLENEQSEFAVSE